MHDHLHTCTLDDPVWILYLLPEIGSVCGVAVLLALMYNKMQVYSSCYLAKYTYFNITNHMTVLTESNTF